MIGGNEYILASTPIIQSQLPSQTKITFSPTSSEVKVKFKYGTSAWTWHGHSICIMKPVMVSETYYVDVCDGGEDKYRFGFNGQEKVNEMKGKGNSLDFGARMYDSRVGRFLSLDPLSKKYPSESNYIFAGNSPIYFIDVDGKYKYPADLVSTYTDRYPLITKYLSEYIENDVKNNSKLIEAYQTINPHLTEKSIVGVAKWKQGYEIMFVPEIGEWPNVYKEAAGGTKGWESTCPIYMNSRYADHLETVLREGNESEKLVALTRFYMTLTHETAHKFDYLGKNLGYKSSTGGDMYTTLKKNHSLNPGVEVGFWLEEMVWGNDEFRPHSNYEEVKPKDRIEGISEYKKGRTEKIIHEAKKQTDGDKLLPTVPK